VKLEMTATNGEFIADSVTPVAYNSERLGERSNPFFILSLLITYFLFHKVGPGLVPGFCTC